MSPHPHLTMKPEPAEHRRGHWSGLELGPLRRRVVGEEDESALVHAAHQHDAGIGATLGIDRRHRHRLRFDQTGLDRLVVPAVPLRHRISVDVGEVEPLGLVLDPSRTDLVGVGHQPIVSIPRM